MTIKTYKPKNNGKLDEGFLLGVLDRKIEKYAKDHIDNEVEIVGSEIETIEIERTLDVLSSHSTFRVNEATVYLYRNMRRDIPYNSHNKTRLIISSQNSESVERVKSLLEKISKIELEEVEIK